MRHLWIAGLFALLFASPIAAQDLVYRVSHQVTAPRVLVAAKPFYTPAMMLRRVQGSVELEVDVMLDGTVGTVALVNGMDQEFDQAAAATARKYKFAPGIKDGKPVPVRTTITVEYGMR
jgi:TonB family protein